MLLLAPLVLVGPLLLLAEAVVTLWRRGPLGWLAAGALVLSVLWATRWTWRRIRTWWAGTKAEVRTPTARKHDEPGRNGTRDRQVLEN